MDSSAPLKPAVFHILRALADGDSYGYAIIQTVGEQSGGRVPLRTGSFYRHLGKLIDGGLVITTAAPRNDTDPRRGTYYRLTARGRETLAAETRRLAELVAAAGIRPAPRRRSI